jgi:hypothetical protein
MSYKTIKISETLHKKLKEFCNENNLKLNKICESYLEEGLLYGIEYSNLKNKTKTKISHEL